MCEVDSEATANLCDFIGCKSDSQCSSQNCGLLCTASFENSCEALAIGVNRCGGYQCDNNAQCASLVCAGRCTPWTKLLPHDDSIISKEIVVDPSEPAKEPQANIEPEIESIEEGSVLFY